MTYEEALSYIHNTLKFGIRPGLERISELMRLLGNPQKSIKCVHIAGTNGKGSVSSMISGILRSAGYKTGLFISPYIIDFRERIQINGEYISKDALAEAAEQVKTAVDKMVAEGFEHPTEFEIITACAFYYFSIYGCDYAVLECGLGGRLDSTNIIEKSEVSVIMSISADHMNVLGSTLTEIAAEKAGIIKQNGRTVLYPFYSEDVRDVFIKTAKDKSSDVFTPDISALEILDEGIQGSLITYKGERYNISMPGHHQIYNALNAVTAAEVLISRGASITCDNIREGLNNAYQPGRFEVRGTGPMVIFDGGHNAEGSEVLCSMLDKFNVSEPVVIMGMLKDKEYEQCVENIAKRCSSFIAVDIDNPRTLSAHEMSLTAGRFCSNVYESDRDHAFDLALKICNGEGTVLICGSLYLISEMRNKAGYIC